VAVDSKDAFLCDSNGCHSALVLLSRAESFAVPVKEAIRDRAKSEGWTTDHQDRDPLFDAFSGATTGLNRRERRWGAGTLGASNPYAPPRLPRRCPHGHSARGDEMPPIRNPSAVIVRLGFLERQRPKVPIA